MGGQTRPCNALVPDSSGRSTKCRGNVAAVAGGRGARGTMGRCARCGWTGPLSVHQVEPPRSEPPEPEGGMAGLYVEDLRR